MSSITKPQQTTIILPNKNKQKISDKDIVNEDNEFVEDANFMKEVEDLKSLVEPTLKNKRFFVPKCKNSISKKRFCDSDNQDNKSKKIKM